MALATPPAQRRLHYAWIVAGVTFLTLLAAAGIRSTPSVLLVPLEREFGWSRAAISFAVSINLILYGLMGPFSAALVDRLGARATMLIAMTTLAIGVSLTSLMTATWQLVLLWGIVVGGGSGMIALALAATVVNRWFTERRGLVMGVLTASTATGQLVFLPFIAAIVERYGWRAGGADHRRGRGPDAAADLAHHAQPPRRHEPRPLWRGRHRAAGAARHRQSRARRPRDPRRGRALARFLAACRAASSSAASAPTG